MKNTMLILLFFLASLSVLAGPNAGDTDTDVTDSSGEATFTYTGDGGIGTDFIEATFVDASGRTQKSNKAEKEWEGVSNTPPEITISPDATNEAEGPWGSIHDWDVSATDAEDDDASLVIDCDWAGNVFPIGSTTVTCSVTDSGGMSASASFTKIVEDTIAPLATCDETVNPSGNKVPKAGKDAGKSGQNPDGYYVIGGSDGGSGLASVVLEDTGSDAVFGPWDPGTIIKLMQAAGVTPNIKPGVGTTDWKVQLNGDGVVVVTDVAGHSTSSTCLIPQPPK